MRPLKSRRTRTWQLLLPALVLGAPALADGPTFTTDVKVENANPDFLLTDTDGPDWAIEADEPVAGAFAIAHQGGGVHALVIENGAPQNSLRVDSSGRIGIGTGAPDADLTLIDRDNDGLTRITLAETNGVEGDWQIDASSFGFEIRQRKPQSRNAFFIAPAFNGFLHLVGNGFRLSSGVPSQNGLSLNELEMTLSAPEIRLEGSTVQLSSRESKTDIRNADSAELLRRLLELPISEYRYRTEDGGVRHLGPMAEDFHGVFGLGAAGDGIPLLDLTGVALAAVQGLKASQDAEVARLTSANDRLAAELAQLQLQVARLAAGNAPQAGTAPESQPKAACRPVL